MSTRVDELLGIIGVDPAELTEADLQRIADMLEDIRRSAVFAVIDDAMNETGVAEAEAAMIRKDPSGRPLIYIEEICRILRRVGGSSLTGGLDARCAACGFIGSVMEPTCRKCGGELTHLGKPADLLLRR